ncbi:MAG: S8/S53 family peptidase [Phycisphaerae bacterium]|nr:S8/S53 family peptidase [Saprospiraceae bacterium]
MPASNRYYYYQGKKLQIAPDTKTSSVYFKSGDIQPYIDDKISRYLISYSPNEKLATFNLSAIKLRKLLGEKRSELVVQPVYNYKLDRFAGHAPLIFNNRYLIKFAPYVSYDEVADFCKQYATAVIRRFEGLSNLYLVEYLNSDTRFMQTVNEVYEKNKEFVLYAHPDFVNGIRNEAPNLFDFQKPVLNQLKVIDAWNKLTAPLTPVKVAVLDEGIQKTHADLLGMMATEVFDCYPNVLRPLNNNNFHGTAIAGIIGGKHQEPVNEFVRGVAPNAKLIDIRISVTFQGVRESSNSKVLDGLQAAINRGAKVINISWSHPYASAIEDKINEAINVHNIVVCCAAGNFFPGDPSNTVMFPAALALGPTSGVIAVGACNELNNLVELSHGFGFGSRRGPELTVLAPGHKVVTLKMSTPKYLVDFNGTSAATAYISGIAALLLGIDSNLKPLDIKGMLRNNLGPDPVIADALTASDKAFA